MHKNLKFQSFIILAFGFPQGGSYKYQRVLQSEELHTLNSCDYVKSDNNWCDV